MTEINNNYSSIIPGISNNNLKPQVSNVNKACENNQINEIQDNGILGKSQVLKTDNVNADIDFCLKSSPEFLQKCDLFFENALETLLAKGEKNAYEKACVLAKEFANEFVQ